MSTAVSQIDLTGVPTMALSQLATHRAREAGGRISGKSLCMQVSMMRIKYCLLRNVCINWRESKSSAKALRSPGPASKGRRSSLAAQGQKSALSSFSVSLMRIFFKNVVSETEASTFHRSWKICCLEMCSVEPGHNWAEHISMALILLCNRDIDLWNIFTSCRTDFPRAKAPQKDLHGTTWNDRVDLHQHLIWMRNRHLKQTSWWPLLPVLLFALASTRSEPLSRNRVTTHAPSLPF